MNAILPGAPWLVAHRSMLGINKPYKITFNNCDYVIWQNSQGKIFALENVCPHMQAPLSNGWICQTHSSITCPFHALEFNREGKLVKDGEPKGKSIVNTLDLVVQDDLIWTYGIFEPRLPIPSLISQRTKGFNFIGVTGSRSIQASFLNSIKINYDFNHQNGVHRNIFRIKDNPVQSFDSDGYYARVVQTFLRENNTLDEIFQNPPLLTLPKQIVNELEYNFPSITLFKAKISLGEVLQFFILYPETENQTRTFVILYGDWCNPMMKIPGLKFLIERSLLKATAKVVEQDYTTVESLYPQQEPKIRLSKEEIMFYVQKLYHEW